MKKIFNIKIKNNSSKPKKKDQTCDPSYEKIISHKQQIKKNKSQFLKHSLLKYENERKSILKKQQKTTLANSD